ncbi:hypothetical protein A3C23_05325 [Candidatus Roizmanbacteria bacterium RIFCSPHIGHO2_02_FULL_37_13b]|uniref:Cation-transporting P-type ATPase N-terminal domain-containing protein n=1 Tax=Candidatus Roizmanbacteria bacterium RIFCSPLOWO2_02_FULL_36_11 TaxID=1802071 RepID=A0A1F7JCM6_9BACT|nr:MAG: hypothetical protein A3C23_05325 [Candidatus Roizmanbacteria bacterium RIFCSPHIGHO2_02_FULL_37_13b]OGK53335.1 MAG: hypothetical protein A3H78_03465 [Candidatus Roizmanbacteria bacterium RIFCSPLOWO2_02_FULL_36_11]
MLKNGLSTNEAEKRLNRDGLNQIPEKRNYRVIASFFNQFYNFLSVLLIGASIISYFSGALLDSFFIFLILALNAALGTYQEYKTEQSLLSLKKMTITQVRVIRDGLEKEIDNRFLVEGDIVHLEQGTIVPADIKIFKSWHFEVNESALTGESQPVIKHESDNQNNIIYLGTTIVKGRVFGEVIKTGYKTRFGHIAQSLNQINDQKTPLQKKLDIFTGRMGAAGILASLVVFFLTFIRSRDILESFIFGICLAVAAVPEGLPSVMTISLAIGVERMAKRGAIVRKISAVEGLGSITVLATDKTGTLTTNRMVVEKIAIDGKISDSKVNIDKSNPAFRLLVLNGIMCSTSSLIYKADKSYDMIGDPTEGALLIYAREHGMDIDQVRKSWQIIDEAAFDSVKKSMSVMVKNNKDGYVFTKGAPESVINSCTHWLNNSRNMKLKTMDRKQIIDQVKSLARTGYRTLAFSYKNSLKGNIHQDQIFLGFVAISDPLRSGIQFAVKAALDSGIKVLMITGDNEFTAAKIGIDAGIIKENEDVITGEQLDSYSDDALSKIIGKVKIFARTTPYHKYRLVKILQSLGESVAVTGDGINDALALKQADIGIAMGLSGTDVSKDVADIVLTDDNFATLISAIEEGRSIYHHIKNSVIYLLTTNTAEVFAVIFSAIIGIPPILTALQILYINLVTDGLPALSLAFTPQSKHQSKLKWNHAESIINISDFRYIIGFGLIGSLFVVISFMIGLRSQNLSIAQTMAFTTLIFLQPFILVDLWLYQTLIISHLKSLKKTILLAAIALPLLIHPLILYLPFFQRVFHSYPLNFEQIFMAFIYACGIIIFTEGRKITSLFRR